MLHLLLAQCCLTDFKIDGCRSHSLEELARLHLDLVLHLLHLLGEFLVGFVELGILILERGVRDLKCCNGAFKNSGLFCIGNLQCCNDSCGSHEVRPTEVDRKAGGYCRNYRKSFIVNHSAINDSRSHIDDEVKPVAESEVVEQACSHSEFVVCEISAIKAVCAEVAAMKVRYEIPESGFLVSAECI